MGRLVHSAIGSLDGYLADADGSFAWAEPDEEVFAFVTERERASGPHLYGRRMYELMTVWETDPALAAASPASGAWARVWLDADKVVYSTTLAEDAVVTRRTRLERSFDPEAVRRLVAEAEGPVSVSGPTLAQHAFRAGLVDDVELYLVPVVVGGGLRYWPDGVQLDLELVEQHRFASGVVFLHHRRTGSSDT